MKDLLKAVQLTTDTTFNYQTGTRQRSYLEINNDCLHDLMKLLGAKTFAVHVVIISNWKNPNGLPSGKEIAEITELSVREVQSAVYTLLNLKIDDIDFYNKERLKEKNIHNHTVYHV